MTTAPARRGPGRHSPAVRRLPVVAVLVAALVATGLVDRAVTARPPQPPLSLAAAAAPAGSESSDWYCTGGSGTAGGPAATTLSLVNTGTRAVTGTLTVTSSSGSTASEPITVAPGRQASAVPADLVQGPWLASRVDLDGGGVTVGELVDGSAGWAEAPCASATAPTWYFASGATTDGSLLFVSVYNPAATMAVVDLTFVTPGGVLAPEPFQGLVLAPGAVVVAEVASYVQDQPSVATVVRARSGQVVADELEEHDVGGVSGLSLRLGTPAPARRWLVPRTVDVTGGRSELVVFNPTPSAEQVTVDVALASGPVAPTVHQVPADSAWTMVTSALIRVPGNTDYTTMVTSTGAGVVVDRVVRSSASGSAPQWGAVTATPSAWASAGRHVWTLPNPAVPATPPVAGAAPFALDLLNPGTTAARVSVTKVTPGGPVPLGRVWPQVIPPGGFFVVEPAALAAAGQDPLVVRSSGPMAATLDATPAGMPGVVSMEAVPQAG